jgi:hypothetical protein
MKMNWFKISALKEKVIEAEAEFLFERGWIEVCIPPTFAWRWKKKMGNAVFIFDKQGAIDFENHQKTISKPEKL